MQVSGSTAVSQWRIGGGTLRGFPLQDLLDSATFGEVAYLLLFGDPPTHEEIADFQSVMCDPAEPVDAYSEVMQDLPLHCGVTEAIQAMIGGMAGHDSQSGDDPVVAAPAMACRIIAAIPSLGTIWSPTHSSAPARDSPTGDDLAGEFLQHLINGPVHPAAERAMDAFLMLQAEAGLDHAALTVRLAASASVNLYSAVLGAVPILLSPIHVERLTRCHEMIPDRGAPLELPEDKEHGDLLAIGPATKTRARAMRRIVIEYRMAAHDEARPASTGIDEADIDEPACWEWYAAILMRELALPPEACLLMTTAARVAGWTAHFIEQISSEDRVAINAEYLGPPVARYVPLEQRA